MSNILGLAGAQPQKQTRFAPIYTGRWSSGIWTNRSPMRDATTTRIVEKFYGAIGLGARIRQLRAKAGYSQITFADATGFTQSFVSRLETGKVELSIGSLRRISAALDISLSQLFRGL